MGRRVGRTEQRAFLLYPEAPQAFKRERQTRRGAAGASGHNDRKAARPDLSGTLQALPRSVYVLQLTP